MPGHTQAGRPNPSERLTLRLVSTGYFTCANSSLEGMRKLRLSSFSRAPCGGSSEFPPSGLEPTLFTQHITPQVTVKFSGLGIYKSKP